MCEVIGQMQTKCRRWGVKVGILFPACKYTQKILKVEVKDSLPCLEICRECAERGQSKQVFCSQFGDMHRYGMALGDFSILWPFLYSQLYISSSQSTKRFLPSFCSVLQHLCWMCRWNCRIIIAPHSFPVLPQF